MSGAMVIIEKSPWFNHPMCDRRRQFPVKKSLPFVESIRGAYTHRVRYVTIYNQGFRAHMAVSCWCGISISISKEKPNRLLENPSADRKTCATCEGRAIGAGVIQPREINGREVIYAPRSAS